jgi:GGDEF domain-containing protein
LYIFYTEFTRIGLRESLEIHTGLPAFHRACLRQDVFGVLRGLIARLFGFDREISGLQEQVKQLSWDPAYGMWTRPAFIQFCQVMPRSIRTLAFLDLDRIHALDQELGYTEVDRRIQATFSVSFRRSDVVARWYSGDEIVILFDSDREWAEMKMAELTVAARAQGMGFKYAIGNWDVGKQLVEDVVDRLSKTVLEQIRENLPEQASSR